METGLVAIAENNINRGEERQRKQERQKESEEVQK